MRYAPVAREDRASFRQAHDVLGAARCDRCGYVASNVVHDVDERDREWAVSDPSYYLSITDLHEFQSDPATAERVMDARKTLWRINALRREMGEAGK